VAKEAARHWLAGRGEEPLALRAIRIVSRPDGRPQVNVAGRAAPVSVSLAHCGRVAAASVATAAAGVDVEAIEPRGSVFARLALTGDELRLGRGHDRDEWVTRLWTVKEAVAKAAGTGLRGRPKDIVVHRVVGDLAWSGGRVVRSVRYGRLVAAPSCRRPTGSGGGSRGPGYPAPHRR
jgi:phosphopantetheinyl transferase